MVINRAIAVLAWRKDFEDQLQKCNDIVNAIDNGSSGIDTTAAKARIAESAAAHSKVATRMPGAARNRNGKFFSMKLEFEALRGKVQVIANTMDEYDRAAAFILSNGFKIRGVRKAGKQNFTVKNSGVTGTVLLIAKARAERSAHEWWYSFDKGVTWIVLPTTIQASTKIENLTRGEIVKFRHRLILKEGPQEFEITEAVIL
jgi:hypothetical protein